MSIFAVFILLSVIACVYGQGQNLCGERVDPTKQQFVDDPSDCSSYLWCNFNAQNELISVHQAKCPENFLFNGGIGACDGSFLCSAMCEHNTEEILVDLFYFVLVFWLYPLYKFRSQTQLTRLAELTLNVKLMYQELPDLLVRLHLFLIATMASVLIRVLPHVSYDS